MSSISDYVQSLDGMDIDDAVCDIMVKHGPDRHVDGHDVITAYIERKLNAEREACAATADGLVDWDASIAVKAVASGIAEAIRGRFTPPYQPTP